MIDTEQKRKFVAGALLLQGAVTAIFPQLSVRLLKRMLSKNFDNTDHLQAKQSYLRQLRALGVGTVAAAGTDLLLQSAAESEDEETQSVDTEPAEAAGTNE